MLVSTTEIMNYLRCKRKHHLSSFNRLGYTPLWPSTAMHLGTLIHRVGAVWLEDPNTQVPLEDIFLDEATKDLAILGRIHKDLGFSINAFQNNDYWEMVNLGKAMCKNYQAYYKKPLPKDFTLVQPEQTVAIPIPNTEHCECSRPCEYNCPVCYSEPFKHICECGVHRTCTCLSVFHYLEGTLDAIILDPSHRLFVFERKTYGARPNIRHLQRNWQFLSYAWLLQQTQDQLPSTIKASKLGGIAYDGWWKRAAPPKGKTMDDLFFRYFMVRNPDELEEFETDLATIVNEMASQPIDRIPPRTIPAFNGCIDCMDLIDYCDAISLNESPPMHKYVKREMTPVFTEFYARTSSGAGAE
jgi:hypothetical protein